MMAPVDTPVAQIPLHVITIQQPTLKTALVLILHVPIRWLAITILQQYVQEHVFTNVV
jgi:hypothetical protein